MTVTQLRYQAPSSLQAAQSLAQRLQLELVEFVPETDHLLLAEALQLVSADCGELKLDFLQGALEHRRRFGGGELLIKACGRPQQADDWLLDLTAGCGRDAFVAANHGWQLKMCERHPIVHALLEDALSRARLSGQPPFEQMQLIGVSAQQYLSQLAPDQAPSLIYLDPMFPHRSKSAKVKKDMQLLQRHVGADLDADALLLQALPLAKRRVVVKRPDSAPYLAQQTPSYSLHSRGHRFDIYQRG